MKLSFLKLMRNYTIDKLFDILNFLQFEADVLIFFLKSQAGHVLKMFLNFQEISA